MSDHERIEPSRRAASPGRRFVGAGGEPWVIISATSARHRTRAPPGGQVARHMWSTFDPCAIQAGPSAGATLAGVAREGNDCRG
jgi:hypothetical protein